METKIGGGADEEEDMEGAQGIGVTTAAAARTSKSAFCLFFVFGSSCWVTVNFVFAEVPLLVVQSFPAVGNFLTVLVVCCIQAANLAPLCIVLASILCHKCSQESDEKQQLLLNSEKNDSVATTTTNTTTLWRRSIPVLLVLLLNVGCCAALAVTPQPMSLALFAGLCTLAGLAATTSSVVLLPFGSLYPPVYTAAIAAGNTSSALAAGVLSLVQQPGAHPRLSFAAFMGVATALASAALAAFLVLVATPRYRALALLPQPQPTDRRRGKRNFPARAARVVAVCATRLFLQGFVENGLAMGVSAAALLPFGARCFVAATAGSFVAGPLASLLPSLLPARTAARTLDSPPCVAAGTALYLAAAAYMALVAVHCRTGCTTGAAAVVVARVLVRVLTQLGGVRAWTALHGGGRYGPAIPPALRPHAARLGGLALQLGGLAGSITALLLVWHPSSVSSSSSLLSDPP